MSITDVWTSKSRIFIDETKLMLEYIPSFLPHRRQQLEILASMFKLVLEKPGASCQKVILIGPVGTGKTVVCKYFGKNISDYAKQMDVNLLYIHVNCHKNRTLYAVMKYVSDKLKIPTPTRGFSTQELFRIIWSTLENKNSYLILTLDEIDYLISHSGGEVLYDIARVSDEFIEEEIRINFILVTRDVTSLVMLDESIKSSLLHNIINFNPYTAKEIYDILKARVTVEKAMREEAVSEDVYEIIGEIVGIDKGGKGDARLALEILWKAGKIAERQGLNHVTAEHVRIAYENIAPTLTKNSIDRLKKHEKIVLLAIAKRLQETGKTYISMGEVVNEYQLLCEIFNERPRKHTKIWEYIRTLSKLGIIVARLSGPGIRGKTTLVSIPAVSLEKLSKKLYRLLKE